MALKILHLEDDPLDAELIKAKLEAGGLACQIQRVTTGDTYVQALEVDRYDLIISDFGLPSYSGLLALTAARSRAPGTPFIFVSGTIGEERAVESLLEGATDYVLKGSLKRLVPAIRRALEERSVRDERNRTLTALRESEENQRLAMESAQIGMWFWDIAAGKATGTALCKQVLGIAGDRDWSYRAFLDAVHPDDRGMVDADLQRALREKALHSVEARALWPDGSVRWFAGIGKAYYDEAGKPFRMVGVIYDISERRRLEDERTRTVEALKKAQSDLVQAQKMEAIGRLAGGVAHDFNNLLTAIGGYCSFVLHRLPPGDPSREDVEEIQKAGVRAAALTHQLLAFSRRQVLQPRVLDLNAAVAGMTKMLSRVIGENIVLETRLAAGLGRVKADAHQLEQVILNLAVNSRDAMPGGGKLVLETADVDLSADDLRGHPDVQPGPHVALIVKDAGQGMSQETMARIFEPFFTTKEQGKGTGLGLATVYGIVKQSGGCIFVTSELGRGTVFKVCLPRVQGDVKLEEPMSPALSLRGTETVLLVEDDELVRRFVHRALVQSGYRVLDAPTPQRALEIVKENPETLDLVLSDVVMPEMHGFELVKRLEVQRPGLKALFMSGYTDAVIAGHELAAAQSDFLQKPLELHSLLQKVRQVLDRPAEGRG